MPPMQAPMSGLWRANQHKFQAVSKFKLRHYPAVGVADCLPCAFTEQGVAMLSSVLNCSRAVQVNIAIMRTFDALQPLRQLRTHLQIAQVSEAEQVTIGSANSADSGPRCETRLRGSVQSSALSFPSPSGRGRDGHCWPPPAQIRTSGITAYGSYLGCIASKRASG